jgi:hypothetical protein
MRRRPKLRSVRGSRELWSHRSLTLGRKIDCSVVSRGPATIQTSSKVNLEYIGERMILMNYMLDYVIKNHGLESFTVVKGLQLLKVFVSDRKVPLSQLFGSYVNTFYQEKELQDTYKSTKDKLYNQALRETI